VHIWRIENGVGGWGLVSQTKYHDDSQYQTILTRIVFQQISNKASPPALPQPRPEWVYAPSFVPFVPEGDYAPVLCLSTAFTALIMHFGMQMPCFPISIEDLTSPVPSSHEAKFP